jgi:YfiH family protein
MDPAAASNRPYYHSPHVMSALESPLLRAAGFRHGFSVKPFDFALQAPELAAHEEAIALLLRLPYHRMFRVSQVHGARAVTVRGGTDVASIAREEADALVASDPETAVGVRTADCVPVLLANSKTGAVAAVHAGWRGVVHGVVRATLEMGTFDLAAIGPCIGVCCFDVGDDVAKKLAPHVKGGKGDLRGAVRAQLVAQGIDEARIDDVAGCTHCDAARFFSHRRDGEAAGRHLSIIATR